MNNFFLLNEAIDLNDYKQFKEGVSELMIIEKEDNDNFLKHNSVWETPVITNNLFSTSGQEENAIILFIEQIKTIDGLEISNIQLTEKDNVSILLGTVTNKTNETKGDYPVNIIIYDENEKEITTIGGYIGEVNPGESTQLNSSATFDYANAYDFRIEKTK